MATMLDVLRVLSGSQRGMLSGAVADALWPVGPAWGKPHHGGPSGGQRAAAGLLGKLTRRGLVRGGRRLGAERTDDPRTWWHITDAGRQHLAANPIPHTITPRRPTLGDRLKLSLSVTTLWRAATRAESGPRALHGSYAASDHAPRPRQNAPRGAISVWPMG